MKTLKNNTRFINDNTELNLCLHSVLAEKMKGTVKTPRC